MIHMTAVQVTNDHNAEKTHQGADRIEVVDGHLKVRRGGGTSAKTLAIYAPGRWWVAKVIEDSPES